MTPIKLYLDEDVRPLLAEILTERGFETTHTLFHGNSGKTDLQQLEFAAQNQLTLLTHNIRDFANLHTIFLNGDKRHFGIICAPQLKLPLLVSRTLVLLSSVNKDSASNNLFWI